MNWSKARLSPANSSRLATSPSWFGNNIRNRLRRPSSSSLPPVPGHPASCDCAAVAVAGSGCCAPVAVRRPGARQPGARRAAQIDAQAAGGAAAFETLVGQGQPAAVADQRPRTQRPAGEHPGQRQEDHPEQDPQARPFETPGAALAFQALRDRILALVERIVCGVFWGRAHGWLLRSRSLRLDPGRRGWCRRAYQRSARVGQSAR